MGKPVLIGDFLHRIKRPIKLDPTSRYKLVTVKLYHKGVVLREEKLGADIQSNMYQVKEGDFILSGIDARNGAFGIVPPELDGAVVTNDFWYFEIEDEIVDKSFFLELTTTHWFDEICRKGSDGTTQRIRLQKGKFFNQTIYVPDLKEQRLFNKRFQAIKASNKTLTAELTYQKSLLKKLRQQILQDAIEGKLTAEWRAQNLDVEPASELLKRIDAEKAKLIKDKKIKAQKTLLSIREDEKPFALPEGWEWFLLDEITYMTRGSSPRPIVSYFTEEADGVNWIKIGDTKNVKKVIYETRQKITREGAQKSQYVEPGDFILSNSMSYGKPFIMGVDGYIHDGWFLIKMLGGTDANYFYYLLLSSVVQAQFVELANGAVVQNIRAEIVKKTKLPVPPYLEQKAIVTKVENLFALCDQLEAQIIQNQIHAEQLMQVILKEAFGRNSAAESSAKPKVSAHA